jgi:hypothetical protein
VVRVPGTTSGTVSPVNTNSQSVGPSRPKVRKHLAVRICPWFQHTPHGELAELAERAQAAGVTIADYAWNAKCARSK